MNFIPKKQVEKKHFLKTPVIENFSLALLALRGSVARMVSCTNFKVDCKSFSGFIFVVKRLFFEYLLSYCKSFKAKQFPH